jgi:hypothetical protein
MAGTQDASAQALLDQQRVLAEFGEAALRVEDLGGLLHEACRLVGRALKTDLAKVVELLPDGRSMIVRAGVGWRPGVVNEAVVSTTDSPEGLTLKDGAVISTDVHRKERFRYHEFLREHGVQSFVKTC